MTSTPSPLHPLSRLLAFAWILILGLSLAACGGGGGGSSGGGGATTYTVSGSVSGASSVTVALSGAATASTTTDASGNYSFASLANGSYTVTPSKSGYTFAPTSSNVTVSGANGTVAAFTATAAATYTISGTISGAATSGVTLQLGGAASASTVSAAGGTYSFTGLAPGSYTVTPSLGGYTFAPTPNLAVTLGAADSTGNNFTATAVVSTFSISGTVTVSGSNAPLSGVTVTATNGPTPKTATTDASGAYTLTGMADGTYTLTPSLTGYQFSLTSLVTPVAGANVTAQNFSATASVAPTYKISGTITGPWTEKVVMTLGGAASGTTVTSSTGTYSFLGLPAGNYTVTPALPGYAYSPAAPSVAVTSADAVQNFTGSTVGGPFYTISGTVSYAGSKTGKVMINVYNSCCLQQSPIAGTSVDLDPVSHSAPYTVRGLMNNSYVVAADMDTLATGASNVANPSVTTGTLTLSSASLTQNLVLADPATASPAAPTSFSVQPADQGAAVFYNAVFNAGGQEMATDYTLYWGTDVNASNGSSVQFRAQGPQQDVYFATGLTNSILYFKMTASINGGAASTATAVVGPITIGPHTGANTVSGTVTLPGPAASGATLHVGVYDGATGTLYGTAIVNPSLSQAYSVPGVPNGTYQNFAFVDQNKNNLIDAGDYSNVQGTNPPTLVVSGNTTGNLVLPGVNALSSVRTTFWSDGTNSNFGSDVRVDNKIKRVVGATLYSAPNGAPVPFDMPPGQGNDVHLSGCCVAAPTTADVYAFRVKYSDGTTQDITAGPVAPILGASALPTNLVVNTGSPYTRIIPQFQWSAPATPPASYAYSIYINPTTGGQVWNYPNGVGMPSTQLNVVYDVNGTASQPSLTPGSSYNWAIVVTDPTTRNQSQLQAPAYTP